MPNECVNHVTITSSSETDITTIITKEFDSIPGFHIDQIGKRGIRVQFSTAWKPDFPWLQALLNVYPSCWIKNEWIVEDGKAGVWIGYHKDGKHITSMEWEDISIEAEHYLFTPLDK